jgi:hypothetical protein
VAWRRRDDTGGANSAGPIAAAPDHEQEPLRQRQPFRRAGVDLDDLRVEEQRVQLDVAGDLEVEGAPSRRDRQQQQQRDRIDQ